MLLCEMNLHPKMRSAAIFFFALLIISVLASATLNVLRRVGDGAEVIELNPGQMELRFWTHSWQMPYGLYGNRNIRSVNAYYAALIGNGTIFTNPPFLDIISKDHCIGIINLDMQHKLVTVDMNEIISTSRSPVELKSHPANGIYPILSIRKGLPLEEKIFMKWVTNSNN